MEPGREARCAHIEHAFGLRIDHLIVPEGRSRIIGSVWTPQPAGKRSSLFRESCNACPAVPSKTVPYEHFAPAPEILRPTIPPFTAIGSFVCPCRACQGRCQNWPTPGQLWAAGARGFRPAVKTPVSRSTRRRCLARTGVHAPSFGDTPMAEGLRNAITGQLMGRQGRHVKPAFSFLKKSMIDPSGVVRTSVRICEIASTPYLRPVISKPRSRCPVIFLVGLPTPRAILVSHQGWHLAGT